MPHLPHVVIHTDGACSGNPGPGGWGAILTSAITRRSSKAAKPNTTNNRMELMAAISALEALKRPCRVDLHTDSQYLRNGIMTWIANWKRNGWRTADKKPVKNVDLWQRLDAALGHIRCAGTGCKGHAGHAMNERADVLAREAIAEIRAAGSRNETLLLKGAGRMVPAATLVQARGADPHLRIRSLLPLRGRTVNHIDFSRLSAPEISALPGASSTLSVFTTPSSTTMA